MTEKYIQFANRIPKENKIAAKSLSGQNDLRWAVVAVIIEDGALPFSRLEEKLDIHQQRLSDALSALQRGGIIEKKVGDELGAKYSGKYAITSFGKEILDGFYQASEPKFESKSENSEFTTVQNYEGAQVQSYEPVEVTSMSKVARDKEYAIDSSMNKTHRGEIA